jgi:acetylornithine deacetylase/succinyl-diaminopimelate desuccinylase-like protein
VNVSEFVRKTLTDFVRIPSTPDVDMGPILQASTSVLEDLGLEVEVHEPLKAVSAMSGRGGVLFSGHLDTVPVASGWTREQGSWDGGVLYGRGTADMKAGCVAALAAAHDLLDRAIPFSLLFTTDEETTMEAAKALASSDLVRRAAAVVVAEPSRLRVVTSEKGVLWYRATIQGRSAHGSTPHLGDNAVYRMGRVLPYLEALGRPKDPLRETTVSVGVIRGGTKPNLVADTCAVDLDVRHPPTTPRADVDALLRRALRSSGEMATLDLFHEVPPAEVAPDAPHVRRLLDLAGTEIASVTYGTEMAFYAQHNPRCVVFGPGEADRIHVPDERVSLSEVVRAAEIDAAFARALAPT